MDPVDSLELGIGFRIHWVNASTLMVFGLCFGGYLGRLNSDLAYLNQNSNLE